MGNVRSKKRRIELATVTHQGPPTSNVTDVPRGSTKHVRFTEEAAIQDLRERAEKILAIQESEELAEEAVRLGRMVSSDAPLY